MAHKPSLGRVVQMFGLQQGSERPVCLLAAAAPVQEDLQPSGQQSPQEESAQLLLPQDGEQRSEERQQLQHNQQHPATCQQATRPVTVITQRDI